MPYKYDRRVSNSVSIEDGFRRVTLLDCYDKPKVESTPFGDQEVFKFTVRADDIPFDVETTVFMSLDGKQSWKLNAFVDSFKPEVNVVGTYNTVEDGKEVEYEEVEVDFKSAIGNSALGLFYQDDFVNLYNVLPSDATEKQRNRLWERLLKKLEGKANSSSNTPAPSAGNKAPF